MSSDYVGSVRIVIKDLFDRGVGYDESAVKELFEKTWSQCHSPNFVKTATLGNIQDVRQLVSRMIRNGLAVEDTEIRQITTYLANTYVDEKS